ncbi:MAG TPA: TIGR03086 family metal-binding protein [Actinomycetota bacterium]|nr:TIGR03086 family metal-binding protein [Actinomycetota bacterium]
MDRFAALYAAGNFLAAHLDRVGPAHWTLVTPCPEWDVRALLNHVIGGDYRYALMLHGAGPEDLAASRAEDHVGDDPVRAFRRSRAQVAATFAEPGALDRVIQHRAGERTGAHLLGMRTVDYAAHGWDLARTLEVVAAPDPELVAHLMTLQPLLEWGRERGFYAPPPPLPPGAGDWEVWLSLTGRSP